MHDREAILAAVDLPALADELLGDRRGPPRSPVWQCPNPEHVQTGRTPPVTVFVGQRGEPKWHCHGCGIGGTAIDLVIQARGVGPRQAMTELASRCGIAELSAGYRPARRSDRTRPPAAHLQLAPPEPVPEVERYVADCVESLWSPAGKGVLQWLTRCRGLPEGVLRENRVGVDLGPRCETRPSGLREVRSAVVLPVLVNGKACYVQLRTLGINRSAPRYVNPPHEVAPNPRLGIYRPCVSGGNPKWRNELIVTEGVIDALSATAAGYHAAALLGAGCTNQLTALALSRIDRPLVIAFDADSAGKAGASRLSGLLRARNRDGHVLRLREGDLNDRLIKSGDWPLELQARVEHATFMRSGPALSRSTG